MLAGAAETTLLKRLPTLEEVANVAVFGLLDTFPFWFNIVTL